MSQGVSTLQGAHQVAQKLRASALPLKSASETFLPLRSSSVNGGAGLPCSGETYCGTPPASRTNAPCVAEASSRSAACLRYSQLAQPAQAKAARMQRTAERTRVLRFTGIGLSTLLYKGARSHCRSFK